MSKFTWVNGTKTTPARVEVDGTVYDVTDAEYEGETPLSASNLNVMYGDIGDVDDLETTSKTSCVSAINELNATREVKLWENDSPTTAMSEGTSLSLSKSLANFDYYYIVYREMTTYDQLYNTGFIPATAGTRLICVNQNYMNFRTITNNTTSLSVGSNFYITGFGSASSNSVGNIPYQVYGGKY